MKKIKEWHWEITRKCNLRCKHCISDCSPFHAEPQISKMMQTVHFIKRLGCERVMITGGEPLYCRYFWKILEECNRQEIAVHFLTNGTLLTKKTIKSMVGFVEGVGVSLDGSRRKTNDYIRGKGMFCKAVEAIRSLADNNIPVSVFIVVSRYNFEEIEDMIELSRSLGAEYTHISEINMNGRALNNKRLFALSLDQKRQLKTIASAMTGVSSSDERCEAGFLSLYVSWNGFVYLCVEAALRFPSFALGNIADRAGIDLSRAKRGRCLYQTFSGNNLVFCLNIESRHCLLERGGEND